MSDIAVASVVYNLAGPPESRPDLLRSHVVGCVARGRDSVGLSVVRSYPTSPAFRMRRFLAWSLADAEFNEKVGSMQCAEVPGSFYPVVPFRQYNAAVSADEPTMTWLYPLAKRAFKRGFGVDFDSVQERILDNANIDDVDHAYAAFGVALNVADQSSRKYVYKFFQYLMGATTNYTKAEEDAWVATWDDESLSPPVPWRSVTVEAVRTDTTRSYRTDLWWAFLHEETGAGLLLPDAKQDQLWFEVRTRPLLSFADDAFDYFNQRVTLSWQETSTTWRRITMTGMQHRNHVYGSTTFVRTTAKAALQNAVKESEFLVPIHGGVFEALPLVDMMQVSTSCSFLVFNCVEEDADEWYETWWFKVILVVVIVVVSVAAAVLTGGTSLGPAGAWIAGLLTGAGLSTTAAIVLAAAKQALAGILVSMLISGVTTEVFGDEWGPLIGAIVSFVFSFGMSVVNIGDLLGALTKPEVWFSLACATGNGVAAHMQGQAANLAEDTAKLMGTYSEKTAEVQRMYQEMQGGGTAGIDPSLVNRYISEATERPSDFFKRTLATGSDVAELTLDQVSNFCRTNLQLVLP